MPSTALNRITVTVGVGTHSGSRSTQLAPSAKVADFLYATHEEYVAQARKMVEEAYDDYRGEALDFESFAGVVNTALMFWRSGWDIYSAWEELDRQLAEAEKQDAVEGAGKTNEQEEANDG